MGGSALDTVAVVYATAAGFTVTVEILEIIVKIDGASAKIAP